MAGEQSREGPVFRRSARAARRWPALTVVALAFAVAGVGYLTFATPTPFDGKQAAAPLIAALERFHRQHGRYPADLDALVSEGIIPAIPRIPWSLDVAREGFGYDADPSGSFYLLFYSEKDRFEGLGPTSATTYRYPSVYGKWTTDPVPAKIQALELAGRRFVAERSSTRLKSFIAAFDDPFFPRIHWENVATVLSVGRPCEVDGRPGIIVRADDAEAAEYRFLVEQKEMAGVVVREISAIDRRVTSVSGPTWQAVFRPK